MDLFVLSGLAVLLAALVQFAPGLAAGLFLVIAVVSFGAGLFTGPKPGPP